jgi:hypothetical protein
LLHKKLAQSEIKAVGIVIATVSLAHNCASKIEQKLSQSAQSEARDKLGGGLERLGNCAKRGSANLRVELDQAILAVVRQTPHDPETLEAILEEADRIFAKHSADNASKTALRALGSFDDEDGNRRIRLKSELQALPSSSHRRIEAQLDKLAISADAKLTASRVFFEMTSACLTDGIVSNPKSPPVLIEYVRAAADLWCAQGLNPSRVHYANDPGQVSPFHRFVDLVLTGIVEPQARRYDDDIAAHRAAVRQAHARLSEEYRAVRPRLRRPDVERLISDDHVKKALKKAPQKSGLETP